MRTMSIGPSENDIWSFIPNLWKMQKFCNQFLLETSGPVLMGSYCLPNMADCFEEWKKVQQIMDIHKTRFQGAVSIRKTVLPGMAIPMLKIRRPNGRLILTWKSPYVDKTVFILRRGPVGCH